MSQLPAQARLLIIAAAIGSVSAVAWGVAETTESGVGDVAALVVLGLLLLMSNRFPLLIYGPNYSEAVSFDDGLLAVVIALVPSGATILLFATTQLCAQVWRRRQPVKAIFNTAQFTLSAEAAVIVANAVGRNPGHVTPTLVPAILAGVATFIVVNAVLVGTLLKAVAGQRFRDAWREAWATRLLLVAVGTTTGLLAGLAAASTPLALCAVPVVFILLRQVLSGHFDARRDRDRVLGLLEAAQDIHGSMAEGRVSNTLETIASRVLRGEAKVQTVRPAEGVPSTPLAETDGWLVITGRNPGEPFDAEDQRLLTGLATIADGAFANAALYSEVHQQRREMAAVLANLAEGVCAFDAAERPTFWNAAAESLLGMSIEQFSRSHPVAEQLLAPVRRCMQSQTTLTASMTLQLGDGSLLPVSYTCAPTHGSEGVGGVVLAFRDDTERTSYEAQLTHHAFHDQLTGLANRRLFIDRLDQALMRTSRGAATSAVIFVDVDRFKLINDSLGHQAGDRLLKEIANRLTALVRDGDTVARFGGDEFTLLLEDIDSIVAVHDLADRIVRAMQTPIEVAAQRTIVASLSVGIAISRADTSGDDLLHDADLAMYDAKAEGLGRWRQYAGGATRSVEQLDLETDLRAAITDGGIEVFFQPLVDAVSGRPEDAEALVRWNHPQRGLVSPVDFIPIAEETGLILPIGRLVLQEACRQCRSWETELGVRLGVSVNLSARQFQDGELVEIVREALAAADLPAWRLCLEVTETLAMRDIDWTIQTLQRLKDIGVRVAIDDFGTGHSSLNYLKRFPIDVVKIDGSFVHDIDTSVVDNAIVTAVVMLAQTLQITTVAECVESAGQLTKLRQLGCTLIQGYLFAKPMPAAQMSSWLEKTCSGADRVRIPAPRGVATPATTS
jgi:diguanylate cyclase (GGDEF)-like protein